MGRRRGIGARRGERSQGMATNKKNKKKNTQPPPIKWQQVPEGLSRTCSEKKPELSRFGESFSASY